MPAGNVRSPSTSGCSTDSACRRCSARRRSSNRPRPRRRADRRHRLRGPPAVPDPARAAGRRRGRPVHNGQTTARSGGPNRHDGPACGDRVPATTVRSGPEAGTDVRTGGEELSAMDDLVLVRPVMPPSAAVGDAVAEVFDSRVLTNDGPRVRRLEKLLAAELGCAEVALSASGTTAIQLACAALGVTGEVLVPAAAFPAVCQAVLRAGGRPVGVDVDPDYLTLDPAAVRAAISRRTKAILAVHTFGCPADVGALGAIAAAAGIPL